MRIILNNKYRRLDSFIQSLPQIFESEGTLIYCGRNVVKSYFHGEEEFIVKRFKRPNFIQTIGYTWFRASKACRAYEYALKLQALGFLTPQPVAYIDILRCSIYYQGYFVSTRANGSDCTFLRQLSDTEILSGKYDNFIKSLAELLVNAHKKGFMHGDLNLTNIIYKKQDDGSLAFSFIDINRSYFTANPTDKEKAKNLMRLTHNQCLIERIMAFYNELAGSENQVDLSLVKQALSRFAAHKRFVYALKGKKW